MNHIINTVKKVLRLKLCKVFRQKYSACVAKFGVTMADQVDGFMADLVLDISYIDGMLLLMGN